MKNTTTSFRNDLAREATTLCTCCEITRTDGQKFFFTDHDLSVLVGTDTYVPAIGYNRTAVSTSSNLSVDNLDFEGLLDDVTITKKDLLAGRFNYAKVRMFVVNWNNPSSGILRLRSGTIGEVKVTPDGMFTAELRGLNQALTQVIGEALSPECRADLGDSRCKVPIDSDDWARNGTVTLVGSRRSFEVSFSNPDPRAVSGWYNGGVLTWLTGDNAGRSIEAKYFNGFSFEIFLSMPFDIKPGDTFRVRPGCDKRVVTCKTKYNNIINMRAEPYVPGRDALASYPDAQ